MRKIIYMKRILLATLFFLPIGLLVHSCVISDDTCGDLPTALPFFTYEGIETFVVPIVDNNQDGFVNVHPTGVDFTAQMMDAPSRWSNGSLLACSPLPDGYEGAKVPLDSVVVTSLRPYAPSRDVDFDLRAVVAFDNKSIAAETPQFRGWVEEGFWLQFTLPPDTLDVPFQFKIDLFRQDGETFSTTTDEMVWQ